MARKSKVLAISDDDFKELVTRNNSYSDCLRELGLTPRGGSSGKLLKRRIISLECSTEHFVDKSHKAVEARKIPLEEILIKNSTYSNTSRLKNRLVAEGMLEYKRQLCNNQGEWNGQELILQLDHINGDNSDNRLNNLRLLCPNCHSQTDTYAGKNK